MWGSHGVQLRSKTVLMLQGSKTDSREVVAAARKCREEVCGSLRVSSESSELNCASHRQQKLVARSWPYPPVFPGP